jgi:hypothetical protein
LGCHTVVRGSCSQTVSGITAPQTHFTSSKRQNQPPTARQRKNAFCMSSASRPKYRSSVCLSLLNRLSANETVRARCSVFDTWPIFPGRTKSQKWMSYLGNDGWSQSYPPFSCQIFWQNATVAFSLLFGKYCPIMV